MQRFLATAKRFVTSEDGPTATEYAVMLALIIVACIATVSMLGTTIANSFDATNTAIGG